MEKLTPETMINGRAAFLGQEPLLEESFLDAAGLLDLDITVGQIHDHAAVKAALDQETADSRKDRARNTEYFVAARQVVKMWVYKK